MALGAGEKLRHVEIGFFVNEPTVLKPQPNAFPNAIIDSSTIKKSHRGLLGSAEGRRVAIDVLVAGIKAQRSTPGEYEWLYLYKMKRAQYVSAGEFGDAGLGPVVIGP